MMSWAWMAVLACAGSDDARLETKPPESERVAVHDEAVERVGVQEGVQHPPIPADSPAWRHDPGGFVPDHNFYGERTWDGVRMRVAGHLSVIERDRARLVAQTSSDPLQAAAVYRALAADLTGMIPKTGGPETEIPTLVRDAALRDAALLSGQPEGVTTGIAGVRREYFQHLRERTMSAAVGQELRTRLATAAEAISFPAIDAFEDFDDRHAMRVTLWSLYLDAVDPLKFTEPWGYFDAAAHARMVQRLDIDIAESAGLKAPTEPKQAVKFTVVGTGGMPTGDSLIDVAGQPGPRAIGVLEKLDLSEPNHRQWVEDTAFVLNAKMKDQPGGVLSILHTRAAHLDGYGHGSRYYNIKQLRNEGVRQLARAGRFDLARQSLQMNFPLHHQDWECPNREGILLAIDGRLAAQAGSSDASAQLERARTATDLFLRRVRTAEQSRSATPGPPPGSTTPLAE